MIFLCDVTLGKLARYLRMLGLDAPYLRQGEGPPSLAEDTDESVFFTKKAGKAGRAGAVLVHSNDPREQLREIRECIRPYINPDDFMTRCIECNFNWSLQTKRISNPWSPNTFIIIMPRS